jgi:hypothetical protein
MAEDTGKKAGSDAQSAKDKVVKPETEQAIRDAADAIKGTGEKAGTTAKAKADEAKTTAQSALNEARGAASEVGGQVKAEAEARLGEAKGQAEQAKEQAKSKIMEAREQAESRAREEVENRKRQATGAMSTTAEDFRRASGSVEESWLSQAFEAVADQIEGVTRSVENKSPDELRHTAQNAARNHPGLFLAGCFAAGVALSRTLRVAADRQPSRYYEGGGRDRDQGYGEGYGQGTYSQFGTESRDDASSTYAAGGSAGVRTSVSGPSGSAGATTGFTGN